MPERNRRLATATVAAVVTLGLSGVAGSARAAEQPVTPATETSAPVAARPVDVTLLSGDRVTVAGGKAGAAVPAPGRDGIRFVRRTSGDDTYVIPSDAVGAVASGTLDRQLFNVTRLAESSEHGEVPIIVRYADGAGCGLMPRSSRCWTRACRRSALPPRGRQVSPARA